MEVIWDETPTARTYHECGGCGRTINPGETYLRQRIVGYDGPYTYKACAHCRAFVRLYLNDFCPDSDEGWYQEDVEEWVPNTDQAREHRRQFLIGWRHGRDLYPVPTVETVA